MIPTIRISRKDTQWAIAGEISKTVLEQLAHLLTAEEYGDGSEVITGKRGFAALLVFSGLPNEALAKQLSATATPVYLLDFDDDAPAITKFERKTTRVTETRVAGHPADFLDERGITIPGYAVVPSPVAAVGIVEGATLAEAKRAMPDAEIEFRAHSRGVLVIDESGMCTGMLAQLLRRRAYIVYRNRESGRFSCMVQEPDQSAASYSPARPDPNLPPLDNILGETTLEGILRALAIPGELLGLHVNEAAGHDR